jgi:hypothetical protein
LNQLFRKLKNKLAMSSFKPRSDTLNEPLPVVPSIPEEEMRRIITLTGINVIDYAEEIRRRALASLINYKDCCAWPKQCRFFFLQLSDEPYYQRSWKLDRKPLIPSRLYVTKRCCLEVKGFRRPRQECPFKSVESLEQFEKKKNLPPHTKNKAAIST